MTQHLAIFNRIIFTKGTVFLDNKCTKIVFGRGAAPDHDLLVHSGGKYFLPIPLSLIPLQCIRRLDVRSSFLKI